jgi:hypothetical protein
MPRLAVVSHPPRQSKGWSLALEHADHHRQETKVTTVTDRTIDNPRRSRAYRSRSGTKLVAVTETQQAPSWAAAEELVRQVRILLDYEQALEVALGRRIGRDEARSRLRQLEHTVSALEIELWHAGTAPDRTRVQQLGRVLRGLVAVVGIALLSGTANEFATDLYDHLTRARHAAEQVDARETPVPSRQEQPVPGTICYDNDPDFQ